MVNPIKRNDYLAVKRWAGTVAREIEKSLDFKPFMGTGPFSLIQQRKELEKNRGDTIIFQLLWKLSGIGVVGTDTLRGKEESLEYSSDALIINQLRNAVAVPGMQSIITQMIEQEQRDDAKEQLVTWHKEMHSLSFFNQIGGFTGDIQWWNGLSYYGNIPQFRGMNDVSAPSSMRHIFAGGKKSEDELTETDTFDLHTVDKLRTKARLANPAIRPIQGLPGGAKFVMFISLEQWEQIRTNTSNGQWVDISKFISATDERGNRFAKGALGMWNDVMFVEHEYVPMGVSSAGKTLPNVRRAIFCGAQAAQFGAGSYDKTSLKNFSNMKIVVDPQDYEEWLGMAGACMYGIKKSIFNRQGEIPNMVKAQDFGTFVYSTYAEPPEYTAEAASVPSVSTGNNTAKKAA